MMETAGQGELGLLPTPSPSTQLLKKGVTQRQTHQSATVKQRTPGISPKTVTSCATEHGKVQA